MSVKSNDDYDEWRKKANEMLQQLFSLQGHSRFYEFPPNFRVDSQIAFAIFGCQQRQSEEETEPINGENEDINNLDPVFSQLLQTYRQTYNKMQRKKAIEIREKMFDLARSVNPLAETISVSFIMVVGQMKKNPKEIVLYPVFRVLKQRNEACDKAWFVDQEGRVYETWEQYLNENHLPRGQICYPANGYYSSSKSEHVTYMPNAKIVCQSSELRESAMIKLFDTGVSILSLCGLAGTICLLTGVMLPPAGMAVILYGNSASSFITPCYASARSAYMLVDRYKHCQAINPLSDSEATQSWLAIANSVSSLATGGINAYVATALEAEQKIGTALQEAVWVANGSRILVSAASTANQGVIMYQKGRENWTSYDLSQIILSTYFFADSIISFQTPASIGRGLVTRKENALKNIDYYRKMTNKLSTGDLKDSVKKIELLNKLENVENFKTTFNEQLCKAIKSGEKFEVVCVNEGIAINGIEFTNVKNIGNIQRTINGIKISGIEFNKKYPKTVDFLKIMAFNYFKDRFLGHGSLDDHMADAKNFTQNCSDQTKLVAELTITSAFTSLNIQESYLVENPEFEQALNDTQWENLYNGLQFLSLQNIHHVPHIIEKAWALSKQLADRPLEVFKDVSFALVEYIGENAAAHKAQNHAMSEEEAQKLVINSISNTVDIQEYITSRVCSKESYTFKFEGSDLRMNSYEDYKRNLGLENRLYGLSNKPLNLLDFMKNAQQVFDDSGHNCYAQERECKCGNRKQYRMEKWLGILDLHPKTNNFYIRELKYIVE